MCVCNVLGAVHIIHGEINTLCFCACTLMSHCICMVTNDHAYTRNCMYSLVCVCVCVCVQVCMYAHVFVVHSRSLSLQLCHIVSNYYCRSAFVDAHLCVTVFVWQSA